MHVPVVQRLGDGHERLRLVGALVEAQLVPRVERIREVALPKPGGLVDPGFELFEVAHVSLVALRPRGTCDPGARQVARVGVDEVIERGRDGAERPGRRRLQLIRRELAAVLEQALCRPGVVTEGLQQQLIHDGAKSSHRRACGRWSQISTALGAVIATPRTRMTPIITGLGGSTESMLSAYRNAPVNSSMPPKTSAMTRQPPLTWRRPPRTRL